jgi:hypothetical protein
MGNGNAVKHGIYRAILTEEERAEYDRFELGGVDEELRLVRVRLARALKVERDNLQPDRDYTAIIERLLGRIESLEQTRKKLAAEDQDNNIVVLIDHDSDIE